MEELKLIITKGPNKTRVIWNCKDIIEKMGEMKEWSKKVKQIIESYLKNKLATSVTIKDDGTCVIKGVDKIDIMIREKVNMLLQDYFHCEDCNKYDIKYVKDDTHIYK